MPTTRSPRSSSALATWKPMNPAAPVRRIDMTVLALDDELSPSRPRAAACPIASLHRRQGFSRDHRVLETTAEVFKAKGQARLLKDLPQHRLAPGCETFFEPIASRHEIINPGFRLKRVPDSQGMGDDAGALPPIGIGESALIGINPSGFADADRRERSEEHTSELQSREK